ncbi:hypothetical protein [Photobacterium damselae]|uniref:hypothetical protein n=1 Tax=Photobacterium damselae TaxID=38293 RepID=UPI003B67920F
MKFIISIMTFMLLCGPRLNFPDLNLVFSLILAFITPFFLFGTWKLRRDIVWYILLLFGLLFISIISVVANDVRSLEPLDFFLKLIVSCLAAYSLVCLYKSFIKGEFHNKIAYNIQVSYIINAIFICCVMFIPGFGEFSSTLLSQNDKMVALASESVRAFDMTMGGGAVASIVFSVVFVFSLSRFYFEKDILSALSIAFSFMAMMFTGRTGLYLSLVAIVPVFIACNYLATGRLNLFFVVFSVLRVTLVGVLIVAATLFSMSLITHELYELVVVNNFSWAFEPIIGYFESGGISTESTDELLDMYSGKHSGFLDVFSFFGNALSGRDELFYLNTDIGYLRMLSMYGIFGAFLMFGQVLYFIYTSLSRIKFFVGERSSSPFVISLLYYCFAILIVNFKEYHLVVRSGFPLLLILFFVVCYLPMNKDRLR